MRAPPCANILYKLRYGASIFDKKTRCVVAPSHEMAPHPILEAAPDGRIHSPRWQLLIARSKLRRALFMVYAAAHLHARLTIYDPIPTRFSAHIRIAWTEARNTLDIDEQDVYSVKPDSQHRESVSVDTSHDYVSNILIYLKAAPFHC
jgi:hypothetical protein